MTYEVEEKLRKLSAIDAGKGRVGWLMYLSGEGDERQRAEEFVDILLYQAIGKDHQKQILLEPPRSEFYSGTYRLGSVRFPPGVSLGDFGLLDREWIKHVLITGMTGTGKTNLSFQILWQFKKFNKPFLVFDWKRNYRDLVPLPVFTGLKIFTVGRTASPIFFNPLQPPPGTKPGEWLMKLVDVIKHAYFVGDGVEFLLRQAIDWVYDKSGYFDNSQKETPTFYQVRDYISKLHLQGRMSLWKASCMRVLESLCFRHGLGPVVNTHLKWNFEELLKSDAVMELDVLSDADKVFFTEAMILWIYEYRKTQTKREEFKHALIIEEAHHILSQKKEHSEGAETIMETCLRQIREFGEAVIVIDQEPSKLSNSIKANTYCKITFNLGNGEDIQDIARCMELDQEEAKCINLLEVGGAIVSLKGRFHQPLLIQVPKVDLKKGLIRDEDLETKSDLRFSHIN